VAGGATVLDGLPTDAGLERDRFFLRISIRDEKDGD
jgi:hypothetical protein